MTNTTRSLVASARAGLAPDAAAAARVRARVAAVVGVGAIPTPAVGSSIGAKLSVLAVVGAVVIGAIVASRDRVQRSSAPAIAAPRASIDDEPRADVRIVAPEVAPAIEIDPPHPRSHAAATAAPATLAREVELIDLAMRSMRDHAPSGALDTIRVYQRETGGHGQLAEDAAAIEIEALCVIHDPTFADKLDAFDAAWPSSAQRSRLTAACRN